MSDFFQTGSILSQPRQPVERLSLGLSQMNHLTHNNKVQHNTSSLGQEWIRCFSLWIIVGIIWYQAVLLSPPSACTVLLSIGLPQHRRWTVQVVVRIRVRVRARVRVRWSAVIYGVQADPLSIVNKLQICTWSHHKNRRDETHDTAYILYWTDAT